jgi:hypothetical protein
MKEKTCPRCQGTGKVNSPVVYCGYPGGCYECDLGGVVYWVPREALAASAERTKARHLAEIVEKGNTAKAMAARAQLEEKESRRLRLVRLAERDLAEARADWLVVANTPVPKFTRGRWCSYALAKHYLIAVPGGG